MSPMARLIIIAAVSATFATSAAAQSEAERRKRVIPSVKATTDCIAAAVRKDPRFVKEAIGELKLWPLVNDAIKGACINTAAVMVEAHDQAYYPGKGMEFLKGPYSDDLPRAIIKRLLPEIEELKSAAQARAKAEAEAEAIARAKASADKEANQAASKLLVGKAYECIFREVATMVNSPERAEVVVRAGMTLCRREVDAALAGIATASGFKLDAEAQKAGEQSMRETVEARLVKARAQSAIPPPPSAGSGPSGSTPVAPRPGSDQIPPAPLKNF